MYLDLQVNTKAGGFSNKCNKLKAANLLFYDDVGRLLQSDKCISHLIKIYPMVFTAAAIVFIISNLKRKNVSCDMQNRQLLFKQFLISVTAS